MTPQKKYNYIYHPNNTTEANIQLYKSMQQSLQHPEIEKPPQLLPENIITQLNPKKAEIKEDEKIIEKEEPKIEQNVITNEDNYDPDLVDFQDKGPVEEEKPHISNEEELSDASDVEKSEDEAKDNGSKLLGQYEKVKRIRNRWKITFKDAVLKHDGKEHIFEKITGEFERDW